MGDVLNPVAAVGDAWQMVQDHGYAPGALILFVLVVLAYSLAVLGVAALAVHMGRAFAEGVRTGHRRSRAGGA